MVGDSCRARRRPAEAHRVTAAPGGPGHGPQARGFDPDEPLLLDALEHHGVGACVVAWDDPSADWAAFDLVVLRSTWDYLERSRGVPGLAGRGGRLPPGWPTRCRSCAGASTSTTSAGLAAAGVPIVPTTFVEPGDRFVPPAGWGVRPEAGRRRGQPGCRSLPRRRRRRTRRDTTSPASTRRAHPAAAALPRQRGRRGRDADGVRRRPLQPRRAKRVALPSAGVAVDGLFAVEDNRPHQPTAAARARGRRRHRRHPAASWAARSTAGSTSCGTTPGSRACSSWSWPSLRCSCPSTHAGAARLAEAIVAAGRPREDRDAA